MSVNSPDPGTNPTSDPSADATVAPHADAPTPAEDESAPSLSVTPSRDLGLMLVSAGIIGVVLPGPGAPALVAGGLMLWPKAFGKAEKWMRRRFPEAHRQSVGYINRFVSDLERRYPGSAGGDNDVPPPSRD